jgi:hypothetical protein
MNEGSQSILLFCQFTSELDGYWNGLTVYVS